MNIRRYGLIYIYTLSVINCLLLLGECRLQFDYDTDSYISAWSTISSLNIDKWRTPVYPVFLGLLKTLIGDKYYLLIGSVIQHVVFLISIRYFYRLSRLVVVHKTVCIWLTAFYALYPSIATWNCFIITEAFAIYGVIFMSYCAILGYKKRSNLHIIGFAFWMLFLIFLRPAQIYILPVFFVGWLLLCIKERKITKVAAYGLLSVFISTGCILGYSYLFKSAYGLFSPCGIGVINRYYIARMDGVIKPEKTESREMQVFINKSINKRGLKFENGTYIDLYDEAKEAIHKFGLSPVSDLVSSSDKKNIKLYIERFFQRFHKASNDKLFCTHIHTYEKITDIIGVRLNFVYFLLAVYPIFLIIWMIANKTVAWSSSVIYMLGFSHMFIIIFACQNVWDRLILPATPLYLIMVGQICSSFTVCRNKKMSFQ